MVSQIICHLIGMFKHNRNPNYLGEMMIYFSFALVANNIIAYLILILIWITIFLPNILVKEH